MLSYLTDNLVPRSPGSCAVLHEWKLLDGPTRRALRRVHWNSLTRDILWSARKIDENYFFLALRMVMNYPNHRSFSHILGFAVTVAIWPREVVGCRDFILAALSLLFGSCHLSEFTLAGPLFTVATSGRRCGIMLFSSKNWIFHFRLTSSSAASRVS